MMFVLQRFRFSLACLTLLLLSSLGRAQMTLDKLDPFPSECSRVGQVGREK